MNEYDALERTYARIERLVANASDGDLARPTPCADWDVRALLGHLFNVVAQFPVLLRGEQPDWSATPDLGDRHATFRALADENLAAWRAPGALDAPSTLLPGMKMVDFNLCDAVVHAWDLARALGEDPALDADAVALVYETWRNAPVDEGRKYGAFGPAVDVPVDAPVIDRLLGLLGRQPQG